MHNHGDLLKTMDLIAPTGPPFMIHPHDQALMDYIEGGDLGRGKNTPQAYAERQGVIWDTACDVLIRLAEASDCHVHLLRVQTVRSIDAVRRAKARGVKITCEVNHWAPFRSTWELVERLGPYVLSYWVPDDARAAIWEGLNDGTIDMLSSDHAPHTREEKEVGWEKMWSAHTGTPGIQYQLPLLIEAAGEGKLSLERAVELTAARPAEVFGLADVKGAFEVGLDADVAILDPDHPWTISNDGDLSRCGWTPYDGRECRVAVERTFLRGTEIYADGVVTGVPGGGRMATAPAVATAAN
jgi:dihydroorotase-like cyclic amidohydrolase